MRRTVLISILSVCVLLLSAREVTLLESWKFINVDVSSAQRVGLDESQWANVVVPHDWAIDKAFDMTIDMQMVQVLEDGDKQTKLRTGRTGALPCFGVGWYRNTMESTPEMKGKRVSIEFDGAMSEAKVYLNGEYVGEWPYGYSSFRFDLTDQWNYEGENLLAVRLENKDESSRWYPGAGLYRNVRLVVNDPVHVAHWGTYVTTPRVSPKSGEVRVVTTLENHTESVQKVSLLTSVIDAEGNVVRKSKQTESFVGSRDFTTNLTVKNPKLWDVKHPNLYTVVSEVWVDGVQSDRYTSPLGFRWFEFNKDKGFFLNGERVEMKGVCLHHDLGPLGAAVNYRAIERQLEIMQNMGCNAIRTSHNPPAPELLQLCDKMGFLVQVESFDEWKMGKNVNGYNRFFDEWAERDMIAMIKRNRNHPSVIMWSIGNEIREQGKPEGAKVAQFLTDICRKYDPTRPVTAGFNNHVNAIKNGLADVVDLVGFNYKPYDYVRLHEKHPDMVIYGSETASTVSSRGEYKFPAKEWRGASYEDYHMSSYDYEYPYWASTPDTEFEQQDNCDFIFGEFVWTGFDYLGEPTPYNEGTPSRSSYFGIVDLVGMKKDRFYLYQSKRTDKPMLHVLPHWNWEDRLGLNVPVYAYTTYPKAELFVNGVSEGMREKSMNSKYERYRLMWNDVVYQPGEIKVVAYDAQGKVTETKVVKTAAKSHSLKATPDRESIKADGKDLAYIEVDIVDKNGNFCPRSDNMLFVEVTGTAQLKALCNGDPTDHTPFSTSYMNAFNGKLMLVIQSTEEAGTAQVKVFGKNLKDLNLEIETK